MGEVAGLCLCVGGVVSWVSWGQLGVAGPGGGGNEGPNRKEGYVPAPSVLQTARRDTAAGKLSSLRTRNSPPFFSQDRTHVQCLKGTRPVLVDEEHC